MSGSVRSDNILLTTEPITMPKQNSKLKKKWFSAVRLWTSA